MIRIEDNAPSSDVIDYEDTHELTEDINHNFGGESQVLKVEIYTAKEGTYVFYLMPFEDETLIHCNCTTSWNDECESLGEKLMEYLEPDVVINGYRIFNDYSFELIIKRD